MNKFDRKESHFINFVHVEVTNSNLKQLIAKI